MSQIPLKKNGKINPEVFSKEAEKWAERIYNRGERKKNKSSQLRKFYDEFFKLYQRAESFSQENEFNDIIMPQLHMLIPKVVYAKGRNLVTDEFVEMLKDIVLQIKNREDLKIATQFFEAFIGFYRVYGG